MALWPSPFLNISSPLKVDQDITISKHSIRFTLARFPLFHLQAWNALPENLTAPNPDLFKAAIREQHNPAKVLLFLTRCGAFQPFLLTHFKAVFKTHILITSSCLFDILNYFTFSLLLLNNIGHRP